MLAALDRLDPVRVEGTLQFKHVIFLHRGVQMANLFLKLTDVEGESLDDTHGGEIELQSWSWGESQTGTMSSGGGGGSPQMHIQDLSVSKYMDKSSTTLGKFCANGKHVDEGILTVRKAGEDPQEFLIITMNDIVISSYQTGSGGDALPMESLSLNFATVKVEYKPQKADGTLDAGVEFTVDIKANKVT